MDEFEMKEAAALLLIEHHIDPESAQRSPDNLSSCVCGGWSEGEMEPGWDDHLVDVLWDAGWRPVHTDRTAPDPCPVCGRRHAGPGTPGVCDR
jgi:hypothetical protein